MHTQAPALDLRCGAQGLVPGVCPLVSASAGSCMRGLQQATKGSGAWAIVEVGDAHTICQREPCRRATTKCCKFYCLRLRTSKRG